MGNMYSVSVIMVKRLPEPFPAFFRIITQVKLVTYVVCCGSEISMSTDMKSRMESKYPGKDGWEIKEYQAKNLTQDFLLRSLTAINNN